MSVMYRALGLATLVFAIVVAIWLFRRRKRRWFEIPAAALLCLLGPTAAFAIPTI